jgi:uncharacterized protein
MKVQRINRFFKKVAELQLQYRWWLLAGTLLLVLIGAFGITRVQSTNARDQWFDDNEAIEIATKKFEQQFGNNETIGLLIESEDVFHPEVLAMISAMGNELLEKVPYADEVTSLTDIEISIGTGEGIRVINPFEGGIPNDPEKLRKIRELILSRESLVNKLVSDDGTQTWLSLSLHEYPPKEEWEKETNKDPMFQTGEAAIAVVTDPKWKNDRYTIKAAGMPYTETEERDFFGHEAKLRVLSGFVAMILLLVILLRSFRGVFVPVFTTVAGIIVVFGVMGWLGIGIEANFVTLPVLLGMALAVGYSIHLVNAFKRCFNGSGNRRESVVAAVEETGWPIFFTAMTTVGSVMSFAAAGIPSIRWLGFTAAAVVFIVYLFVMTLIPALMSFGKNREMIAEQQPRGADSDKGFEKLGAFTLRNRTPILIAAVACVALLSTGIGKLSVNMDSFKFMGLKIPYIKRVYDIVNSQLGSYLSYNVTVSFSEPDAIKDPAVLKKFGELLDTIGSFDLTKKNKGAPRVFSVLDIVREMNRTLHGDSAAWHTIPKSKDLVAQLLFLYEMSGGTKTFNWIDEDYSMLRAQVQVRWFDAEEVVYELGKIRELGAKLFPGAQVATIGSAVQFAELNGKIVSGELKSLMAALIIIGILLVLVFGSLRTGLIGMIPNVVPLAVLGGFMGHCNFYLDMMTMTIMPMLLGIAVDDTIHFINHIKYEFEKCGNYRTAILRSFGTVGKTLAMTTVILSATFAMYIPSPVANMGRIGILASMGLLVALLTDYLMTPILIMLTRPFGREQA